MARERLSRLQRHILAWLVAEDQRTRGTMAASHEDLVRAVVARGDAYPSGRAKARQEDLAVPVQRPVQSLDSGADHDTTPYPKGKAVRSWLWSSCQPLFYGIQFYGIQMEAMRRRLEWELFLRAFLEQFDRHVAALRSRGIDMTITPVDGSVFMGEVVLVQSDPRQQFVVRYVRTTGGYELRVRVSISQVDFGKVTGFPSFELVGTRGGDIDRYFLEITFGPTHVAWNLGIGRDNRRSGGHIIGRDSQTEAYRQAVRDGLNLAFEYAVLVATK